MVILAIWSILAGQNRGPYIRNQVFMVNSLIFHNGFFITLETS